MYGKPPAKPVTMYGIGTACATALVIPNCRSHRSQRLSVDSQRTPSPKERVTYKRLSCGLHAVDRQIAARNRLCPVCGRVADLLANV